MSRKIGRRSVLAGAALVPLSAIRSAAQTADSVLTPVRKRCLEAFVDRLIPGDELGPGAVECGVVEYIDRALAGPVANAGPDVFAVLDAADALARGTHGTVLGSLAPEKQDAVLTAIEKTNPASFAFLHRLTLEGMFCDPSYGGNRHFAGWDLIRYPGPRLAVSPEEQKMGVAIKPVRYSANGGNHGH